MKKHGNLEVIEVVEVILGELKLFLGILDCQEAKEVWCFVTFLECLLAPFCIAHVVMWPKESSEYHCPGHSQ